MKYSKYFFLGFIAFLSACATGPTGPKFVLEKPSADKATVYFYRPEGDLATARSPYVQVDRKVAFEAKYLGYVKFELEPGKHKIKIKGMDMGNPQVDFKAEAGATYFLRYSSRGANDDYYVYTGPLTSEMKNSRTKVIEFAVPGLTPEIDDRLFFISAPEGKEEIKDTNLID